MPACNPIETGMTNDGDLRQQSQQRATPPPNPGFWDRCDTIAGNINRRFHFFISLPVVTAIGSFLYSHVDYLTAYQAKLKEIGEQQMKAAEGTYSEVSKSFSEAITLQQLLFFNYRDAARAGTQGNDDALEAKNARAIYLKYDELRTNLRESIDLLSRRVENDLDWSSRSWPRRPGVEVAASLPPSSTRAPLQIAIESSI